MIIDLRKTTLTLAAILAGCSFAPRKPFVPPASPTDKAAIYFYRPAEMTARLIAPTIAQNDAKLGKLANDSYGVAYAAPGEVKVRSTWPGIPGSIRDDSATLHVEAGKSYYVRVRYHVTQAHGLVTHSLLSFENRTGLEEVDEKEAVPQMAGMALCDAFKP